jgi:triosephosphate isomerase
MENRNTIIINFKKTTGRPALEIAVKLREIDHSLQDEYNIILAVQAPDVTEISQSCEFGLFIQDTFSEDKDCFMSFFNDGYGRDHCHICGVILNHPEKKLPDDLLRVNVELARQLGIQVLLCATSINEAIEVERYSPRYIGIESEHLIGKEDSFLNHCPEIVRQAKLKIGTDILIGAGIKNSNDLRHVIHTGGSGILVSSLILKSADPAATLHQLLEK